LFGKSDEKPPTFLQVAASERVAVQSRVVERAMQRIATTAQKHKNWSLVSLAVRMRLDSFTEVKAAMDKMLAQLNEQQKEEYAKSELCKKDLEHTEDKIQAAENTKEDLDDKHLNIANTIETLDKEIQELKADEEAMEVAMKQAGEQREKENEQFQTEISDQRATANILKKALTRLKKFYTPELLEMHTHQQRDLNRPKKYAKSAGAGGAIELIMKVIEDAEAAEKQLEMSEQNLQDNYASFVKSTSATIQADRDAIAEKNEQLAAANAEKSETEGAQLSNKMGLEELNSLLQAHHTDCDWLLKYFDLRQKARQDEIDSITDAKAVLSGAGFGK